MDFHQVKASSINYLKYAKTSNLALWYFKLLLRIKITSQNIWFFKQCLTNSLTPHYMKLKTSNKSISATKAISAGIRRWIVQDMKIEYNKRDVCNIYLKFIHTELLKRLNNIEFDILDFKVRIDVQKMVHKKYLNQVRKLNNLKSSVVNNTKKSFSKRKFSNHTFYNRFMNLTNVNFNERETKLIEKGFKHNIKPLNYKQEFEILCVDCELACNNHDNSQKDSSQPNLLYKHIIADKLNNFYAKQNIKKSFNDKNRLTICSLGKKNTIS